jgi:hypothetical protein
MAFFKVLRRNDHLSAAMISHTEMESADGASIAVIDKPIKQLRIIQKTEIAFGAKGKSRKASEYG